MRRVLSWKRLVIVVAVLLTASAAVYAAHAVQVRRQAIVLKDQASAIEKDPERIDEAIALYARYLKFRKMDESAYQTYANLRLSRAKEDPTKSEDAKKACEEFLRYFPEHHAERRELIGLDIKTGGLIRAKQHILLLFESPTANAASDVDLLDNAATCEIGLGGDFTKAIAYLDKAIETKKAPARMFERILGMLHGNKTFSDPRFTEAKYLQLLLDMEPYKSDIEARIVAARFMLLRTEKKNARDSVEYALTRLPGGDTNASVLIAAAELERAEIDTPEKVVPQLNKMQKLLEKAFDHHPRDVRVGLMLAQVYVDLGQRERAIEVLRKAADSLGDTNDQYLYVVDRLLDLGERDLSTQLTTRIASNEPLKGRIVKYLRGRMALIKGDWQEARGLLEEVEPALVQTPEFHKRAMLGLAQCYEIFQNPDRQLVYYEAALKDDSRYLAAIIGKSETLFRLGRFREALPLYRILVNGYRLEGYRIRLAQLEMRAVLIQPPASRRWEALEESLGPVASRTIELEMLLAESLALRGEAARAIAILKGVLQKDPKNIPGWVALARIESEGRAEIVLARLNEVAKTTEDSVDLRLARSVALVSRVRKPSPDDIRSLSLRADKFTKSDQGRLWRGLGEAASRAATNMPRADAGPMWSLAIECFEKATGLDKNDLIARAVLVDLGLSSGRPEVAEAALARIAEVEGAGGPIGSLARVVIRLPGVRKIEEKTARAAEIKTLRDLAARAKADRPGWGRVYVAIARLDELEGLNDSALTNYLEAIAKGEREEFVIRRAVELHRNKKQEHQAAALLNSLRHEVTLPEDLERFRATRELLDHDIPKSERPTIDRIAPDGSTDWRVLLLRGALLAAIGEDADAQKAFKFAVQYGPHVPETWGALVAHQVRLGKLDDAKATVTQAEGWLRTNPDQTDSAKAELILAQAASYEMIGDRQTAGQRYRDAARVGRAELNPNRQLVLFLQRSGMNAEAGQLLNTLIESPGQDLARWARRHKALTIITYPDAYHERAAALRLIDQNLATGIKDQEDVKARAIVQTLDPTTREEGLQTLREFAKWGDLTPDEYFLLGRLHFDQGKVFEAIDYYDKAARLRSGLTVEHLSRLLTLYLAINKVDLARATLVRLQAFSPGSWEAVRDEARVLKKESQIAAKSGEMAKANRLADEAKSRVLAFSDRQDERFIRSNSAPLFAELGFLEEAERLYRQLKDTSRDPTAHIPLAAFLISQKRSTEALALAREFANRPGVSTITTAQIMTGAVRARADNATAQEVAVWLNAELAKPHTAIEELSLLAAKAQLLEARGQFDESKYDEAITAYEDVMRRAKAASPADARLAGSDYMVNNLCMLLVLRRPAEADRAIALMNELISIRGPMPSFLDTRAVAYLVKGGKTEEAANDLELALIQYRRAGYLFHLGWAYTNTPDKRARAQKQLDEARDMGLTLDDLHPLEARKFNELYLVK